MVFLFVWIFIHPFVSRVTLILKDIFPPTPELTIQEPLMTSFDIQNWDSHSIYKEQG